MSVVFELPVWRPEIASPTMTSCWCSVDVANDVVDEWLEGDECRRRSYHRRGVAEYMKAVVDHQAGDNQFPVGLQGDDRQLEEYHLCGCVLMAVWRDRPRARWRVR